MHPLRRILASLLLVSTAQAYVYLDTWLVPIPPTHEDTFVVVETSMTHTLPIQTFVWAVDERDAQSRPLSASYTIRHDTSSHRISIDYQWGFDLDFPAVPFAKRCPSRFVINNSGSPFVKSDTNWFDWNPSSRTLLLRSNHGMLKEPDCPWVDSIVLDSSNRVVFQAACGEVYDAYPDTASHLQFVRYWYEGTSSHPRSASSRVPDLNWLDTLSVVGPIQQPYGAELVHTTPTESSSSVDSMEWNSNGQLVSLTTREGDRTSVFTSEYDGNRLLRFSARYWEGGSLVDSLLDVYSYTLGGTGISRRAGARPYARIVSANGLAHLRLDLPAPDRVRVERISLDGKRLATLADGNLPAGRSLLPVSIKPGDLVRVQSVNIKTVLVAPLR